MNRMRSALAIGALIVGLVALPGPAAQAYTPTYAKPFKAGTVVRVYNALPAKYAKAMAVAVRNWNTTGARIRMKLVTSATGAHVTVRLRSGQSAPGLTYPKTRTRPARVYIASYVSTEYFRSGPYGPTMLLTHELGHTLGLNHPTSKTCSALNPGFFGVCPTREISPSFTCRITQQTDKYALVRLYGGTATAPGPLACSVKTGLPFKPVPALAAFTISQPTPGSNPVDQTWTPLAGYVVQLARYYGACDVDTSDPDDPFWRADATAQVESSAGSISDTGVLPTSDDTGTVQLCYAYRLISKADLARGALRRFNFTATVPVSP